MEPKAGGLRVAYLGTSEFGARVLERLAASRFRPVLVVAPPDARRGRGRRLQPPPVARLALELGLELLQTGDVNATDARARLTAARAETGLVCAFGQLVKDELLDELELLNVHPSLLPRWRGAAPIERAIMAGDERTGVSIIRLVRELDAGPVCLAEAVEIERGTDFGSLSTRLAELGGELAVSALELRERGELRCVAQPADGVTYAAKIEPRERRLDPARRAEELERAVRALTPHVGAYLQLEDGERLGVLRVRALPGGSGAPGELAAADGGLALACASGTLVIETVRPAGGRAMAAADYLRGNPVPRLASAPDRG